MPPLDFAPPDAFAIQPAADGFAYDEIGWIADLAPSIALRRGVDAASLSGGMMLTDVHLDAEPLWRLARHPRLTTPAQAMLGGEVAVMTTLFCLDVGFPANFIIPGAVLATVHLDRRALAGAPGALHGRFGRVAVRGLSEPGPAELGVDEAAGRSFRVVYVSAADRGRWPKARTVEPVGEADLWPVAHLAFG